MYLRQPGFFSDSVEHFDATPKTGRPTRSGHVWVEDKRVKGGGYWRKAPKGGAIAPASSGKGRQVRSAKASNVSKAIAGAIIATGMGIAAQKATQKALASRKGMAPEKVKQVAQNVKKAEVAIDKKLGIGKEKPSLAKRIGKEVAIELAAVAAASVADNITTGVGTATTGTLVPSAIAGKAAGRLVAVAVSKKLRNRFGDGLDDERQKVITAAAVRAGVMGVKAGTTAMMVNKMNKEFAELNQ